MGRCGGGFFTDYHFFPICLGFEAVENIIFPLGHFDSGDGATSRRKSPGGTFQKYPKQNSFGGKTRKRKKSVFLFLT